MKEQIAKDMKFIQFDDFIKELETLPLDIKFDNRLCNMIIKKIVIHHDDTIDFIFKDDKVIKLIIND